MIQSFVSEFANDCSILLDRAFLGKTVTCFGSDGNGLFGQSVFAKSFDVSEIEVIVSYDNDGILTGIARISLENYRSTDCGHVVTDCNLKICINDFLKSEYINSECWQWAPISEQGENYFTITFDVHELLNG